MYTIFPYTTFRNYMVIIYNKPCICILFSIPIYIYIPYVYHIISIYTRYCGNSVIGRCLGFGQIQRGAARLSGSAHQGHAATAHLEGVLSGKPWWSVFSKGKVMINYE